GVCGRVAGVGAAGGMDRGGGGEGGGWGARPAYGAGVGGVGAVLARRIVGAVHLERGDRGERRGWDGERGEQEQGRGTSTEGHALSISHLRSWTQTSDGGLGWTGLTWQTISSPPAPGARNSPT